MVDNDENLYRRVLPGQSKVEDGSLRISSQAFSDRSMQPSLDRALLRNNDPSITQGSPINGVVTLLAKNIRSINEVQRKTVDEQTQQEVIVVFAVDVRPDPINAAEGVIENLSHAIVVTDPVLPNKPTFRKLAEALSRLASTAGWTIAPHT